MRHIAVVVASAGLLVVLYACSDISDYTDPTANTTPPALALQHGPAPEVHVAMPATSPAAPASQPTTNRLPPTVLILPFQNLSQGHEGDWAGNSIQQTLAGDVTRTRTMAVLAPVPSSGLIPESPVTDAPSAAHAGEQLHAPYVVFGTYEIVGQDLRINAHVVDTHSAQVMGSLRATGTTAQMFLLQDMLTDQLRIVLRKTSPVGSEQAVSDLYPGPGTAPSTTGPGGMAPYDTTAELPYSEPTWGRTTTPTGTLDRLTPRPRPPAGITPIRTVLTLKCTRIRTLITIDTATATGRRTTPPSRITGSSTYASSTATSTCADMDASTIRDSTTPASCPCRTTCAAPGRRRGRVAVRRVRAAWGRTRGVCRPARAAAHDAKSLFSQDAVRHCPHRTSG
jgi:TolB-like protein